MPEFIKINENTYRIEDGFVRYFLLIGSKKALLVDSGITPCDVKELVKTVTNLPLELLNTHSDPDHTANNQQFDWAYMHPSEAMVYHNVFHQTGVIYPIFEQDTINLGDRLLEVVHIPGHTPGSIGLLDKQARFLIAGDAIQDGEIFLFGLHRDFPSYVDGLKHVNQKRDQFDEIYPSHGTSVLPASYISSLIEDAEKVAQGEIAFQEKDVHGNTVKAYQGNYATFLRDS